MKVSKRVTIILGFLLLLEVSWYAAFAAFSTNIANLTDLDEVKVKVKASKIIAGYYTNITELSTLSAATVSFAGQPLDEQRMLPHMWVSLQEPSVFPSYAGMGDCGFCILFGNPRFSKKPEFGHMGGMFATIDNAIIVWGPFHRSAIKWIFCLLVISYFLWKRGK